jgi:hypothetical protein
VKTRGPEYENIVSATKGLSRRDFLKGLAAVSIGAAGGFGILPQMAFGATSDSITRYTYLSLKNYTDWLAREGAKGFIGEINWPNDLQRNSGDEAQWNTLGARWYSWAKRAGLWTTMHCVDETQLWGGFWLTSYVSPGDKTRPISQPNSQAQVYERYPSSGRVKGVFRNGLQVAGAQKWKDDINSNVSPGVYDKDYWYASQETMNYLKSKGTDIIRLPFRWERLQPSLGGTLNPTELQNLKACVSRAGNAGLQVILSLQNYGGYWASRNGAPYKLKLGTLDLSEKYFYNIWRALSLQFKSNSTVIAYDLMNEPDNRGGMGAGGFGSDVKAWEVYSRRCVWTLRNGGDNKLIVVEGMSGPRSWSKTHPTKWIKDPANNHMYSTHHYFDTYRGPDTGGGHYVNSYANENAYLASKGY